MYGKITITLDLKPTGRSTVEIAAKVDPKVPEHDRPSTTFFATDGGTLLIHDSFSSVGVTAAIARHLVPSGEWRYVGRSRSLTEYRRDLSGGAAARARNAARQLAQVPWFVKNVLVKVIISARLGGVLERVTGRPAEWPY